VPIGVSIGLASAVFTAVVTEIYCHRYLAHRAFRLRPLPALLMDTYFRVIVGTDPESWAGVHRLHHRHADTPLDPHSPVQRRPLAIVVGNPFLFAVAKRRLPANRPAGWRIWGLRSLVVAFYLVTCGPVQVVVMLSVHLVVYMGLGGVINTVGHLHGSKPHPDQPGFDSAWLSLLLLGHGYHNSHHAHPAAARTGRLDPIWPLLRLGAALGQVQLDGPRPAAARRAPCCDAAASMVRARRQRIRPAGQVISD
jgi:stearoyl-CoA desaturase (delta-9 desaturase)